MNLHISMEQIRLLLAQTHDGTLQKQKYVVIRGNIFFQFLVWFFFEGGVEGSEMIGPQKLNLKLKPETLCCFFKATLTLETFKNRKLQILKN